jgi:hypothetical protein
MRPDKPGYWWYLPIRGEAKIAYLAKGYAPYLCVVEEKIIGIHQFESQSNFKQWLDPAYPPKRVDRYIMNTICDSGGFTNEVEMEKYQTGNWIRYEDVKEYLLDEMEPFETDGCLFANLEQEDNEE